MFNTSLTTAAAAALLTSLAFVGAAEAGGCGHGGYGGHRVAYSSPSPAYMAQVRARRAAEARAIAAAKRRKSIEIANAREAAKERAVAAAKTEAVPKATVTASAETAANTKPIEVAASPSTCRKFIPATGTTAEVACTVE
jgi:hypothetical protein